MLRNLDTPAEHPGFSALPPPCPLGMPEQSLWQRHEPSPRRPAVPPGTAWRRAFVFGAAAALTGAAAYEMYQALRVGGLTVLETVVLGMFVLLFAWIALSFVSTLVGFLALLFTRRPALDIDPTRPLPELDSRTALLLPTYNEDAHRVIARLQAIYESLEQTGRAASFDLFILSDTSDPAVWIDEEAAFLQLRARTRCERIYYRHRSNNIGRKAGNIASWVTRFGGYYDCMVVLDADSLMSGDTIVRLAAAMERHGDVGLIQTLPVLLNAGTLFARLQQFANRVYGPLIAHGVAWWYGGEGNYWGHNAIIRVRAFAEGAGLPLLKGRTPFGGHILSHDFVEAALLRRAGWGVYLAPGLPGSYEECPPTLTEYAARDRRWCQGNLQHIGVLPARGLHWLSRLHLLNGIGSYLTAPMWLMFLLVGILISLQAHFIRPEYFPAGMSLFPRWPAQDPVRAAWVFGGTMAMLILPKLLGYLMMLLRRSDRRGIGGAFRGALSVILETSTSALIAPIMMLMQSKAVAEILIGRDSGWNAQRRDGGAVPGAELVRQYALPTLLGAVLAVSAYAVSSPLLIWMLPVVVGLTLAIPITALTSLRAIGSRLRSVGLLLTPEEQDSPAVLVRSNELAKEAVGRELSEPFARLADDPVLLDVHRRMLPPSERRSRGQVDVDLVVATAKIADALDRPEAIEFLSAKEKLRVLANRDALDALLAKPERSNVVERLPPMVTAWRDAAQPIGA